MNQWFIALCLALIMLSGCGQPLPAAQQIKAHIAEITAGLETKDHSQITDHLSEQFLANNRLDKSAIRRMILAHFLRHQSIDIVLENLSVSLNDNDPNRATVQGNVIVSGGSGRLIPDSGRLVNVDSQWQIERGEWRVVAMSWE